MLDSKIQNAMQLQYMNQLHSRDSTQLVSNPDDKHDGVNGDISMKAKAVKEQWGPKL